MPKSSPQFARTGAAGATELGADVDKFLKTAEDQTPTAETEDQTPIPTETKSAIDTALQLALRSGTAHATGEHPTTNSQTRPRVLSKSQMGKSET